MRKQKTLCQLKEAGVIAVVRADSVQEAIEACHAAIAGGLTGIEVNLYHTGCKRGNQNPGS